MRDRTGIPPKRKIDAGRNIVRSNERKFKKGSLMFIQGESSTEMYIVRSGKVRILKQEGEKSVELAVLGAGSVLGELSLLDHQPRSATGQIIEDTTVTVVDEMLLKKTLAAIPKWLSSIVNTVVKRLRDTMKKTEEDIVRKSVGGVLRIMLVYYKHKSQEFEDERRISLNEFKKTVHNTVGIGEAELDNVFLHLILKSLLFIRTNDRGREYLLLRDEDAAGLYMNYLRAKQRGTKLPGEQLSKEASELIGYIRKTGEKNGRKVKGSIMRVGLQQIEIEQNRNGKERFINQDALEELESLKLIVSEEQKTTSDYGTHKRAAVVYNEETLKKIEMLQKWLQIFEEEIKY